MRVCIIGDDTKIEELLSGGAATIADLLLVGDPQDIPKDDRLDAIIDLMFEDGDDLVVRAAKLKAPIVLINSVTGTLENLPDNFVRINGWPGFLKREIMEVAGNNKQPKKNVEDLILLFTKKTEWVADIPGFITTRVICSIINEAYYSLEDDVSTKEEIDIAMKTGTNYPYGPFEWANRIGIKKIYHLLQILSDNEPRYKPSGLLREVALT
jgi:3-hydroxybutyryl-CoA dehydrogenase